MRMTPRTRHVIAGRPIPNRIALRILRFRPVALLLILAMTITKIMIVHRFEFDSTIIERVGYDDATSGLDVHFRSGRIYRYASVPPEVLRWWLKVDSKVGFFARKIRDEYDWIQVTPPRAGEDNLVDLLQTSLDELSGEE